MKVSVVIPVYNGERYVAQCIGNMLCQTCRELEVIVVDDGSTDGSAAVAARYPVRVVRLEKNMGLPSARNAGIAAATGEYIHFMDVDDLVNLEFYERMLDAARHADADVVCGGLVHERIPAYTKLFDHRLVVSVPEDKIMLADVYEHGYCPRYLFRKSFLDGNGLRFDPEQKVIEDLPFSLQAVYGANKLATAPGTVYYYKHRENSILTTRDTASRLRRRAYMQKALAFRKEFAASHGLNLVRRQATVRYKFLGIPMLKKVTIDNRKTRWYLFRVCVAQRKG